MYKVTEVVNGVELAVADRLAEFWQADAVHQCLLNQNRVARMYVAADGVSFSLMSNADISAMCACEED